MKTLQEIASEAENSLLEMASKVHPEDAAGCAAWDWKNLVLPQIERNGIDERFASFLPGWDTKAQRQAFGACEDGLKGVGAIMALTGRRGTGKTTAATQIIIRRIVKAIEAQRIPPWMPYRKLSALVGKFKSLYADFGSLDGEALANGRDALCRAGLLVIDEIHDCDDQKTSHRLLTDICDRRYSKLKDTILISNLGPAEFSKSAGDSILSRLGQHGLIIPCNWKSFRTPNP